MFNWFYTQTSKQWSDDIIMFEPNIVNAVCKIDALSPDMILVYQVINKMADRSKIYWTLRWKNTEDDPEKEVIEQF